MSTATTNQFEQATFTTRDNNGGLNGTPPVERQGYILPGSGLGYYIFERHAGGIKVDGHHGPEWIEPYRELVGRIVHLASGYCLPYDNVSEPLLQLTLRCTAVLLDWTKSADELQRHWTWRRAIQQYELITQAVLPDIDTDLEALEGELRFSIPELSEELISAIKSNW